jgi:uncharacterized protein
MKYPFLGYGLGLRSVHYNDILSQLPEIDWFEAVTENYLVLGSRPMHFLEKVSEHYPVVLHGIGMGIGNACGVNRKYLKELQTLIKHIKPKWVSDHICFTGKSSHNSHDLLPLPYNKNTLNFLSDQVKLVQDYLGMAIVLENPSTYIEFNVSTFKEEDFIAELLLKTGALMLLDVNNVYVSSYNHSFDPYSYIDSLPADRIQQIHVAGHSNYGDYIIDTHDDYVISEVLELYRYTIERFGAVSSMIEWDEKIPSLDTLLVEVQKLQDITTQVSTKQGQELCYDQ